jgi:hypothetical protein
MKPGKYFSASSGVFSLFVVLYVFCGILLDNVSKFAKYPL